MDSISWTFRNHRVPGHFIWIIYTFKTIAYVAAAFLMYFGEFKRPPGQESVWSPRRA
ncbi:MAG: hypothetical protein R2882_13945 [Gemmatimonadales bacterium]